MIKKIIHFSDLHIRLFKDHDLYRQILEDALSQWRELKPDRIVFSGDLVHSKNQLTPELINFVNWLLTECSYIAKTILLIGNHDFIANNLSRIDALSPIIDALNNPNIVYYKDMGVYEDENVSWVVYSQLQDNLPPDISNVKGLKIGLFHGPIQGIKTDIGYSFGEDAYDTSNFRGLDALLCGDIHKRQEFEIPGGIKGKMIGSFIQQGFGEKVTKHGYGILDIETMEYETIDLHNPRPFLNFKIESIEDLEHGTEKLTNY